MKNSSSKITVYIDESANLADQNQFFIIAVLAHQEEMSRILKQTRKNLLQKSKKQVPVLKFSRVDTKISAYILRKLSQEKIKIYAWIIDKNQRRVADTPENYGVVLSYALNYGFTHADWSVAIIDKKYDKKHDEVKLISVLEATLGKNIYTDKKVLFVDSQQESGLMLVDFIAGAFHLFYNRKNEDLIKLIRDKIVIEEKVAWQEIKQKAIAPGGSVGSL